MAWEFLVNCSDDFEASFIQGLLEEKGVPTQIKYRGMGLGHYVKVLGGVGKDVDIYVPQEKMEDAREVLKDVEEEENKGEEENRE